MEIVLLVGLLAWIIGAIWGYRRAVDAGYSEVEAALGALLLGCLAPLLAFIRPRGKRCPFCRSIIDTKATTCPKCAKDQPVK